MQTPSKPLIRIDCAEGPSGIPDLLARNTAVTVEVVDLDSGDYVVGDVGIERKRDVDFLASIRDRRLFTQAKLLAAMFAKPVLILEGRLDALSHHFEDEALTGALSYLTVIEGVSVIPTRDAAHSAALIARMALHRINGLGYEVNLHAAKPAALTLLQQYVVGALPGIGPGRAQKLLAHFGSVVAVFAATEAELAQVPGIGAKLATKVVELLHARAPR